MSNLTVCTDLVSWKHKFCWWITIVSCEMNIKKTKTVDSHIFTHTHNIYLYILFETVATAFYAFLVRICGKKWYGMWIHHWSHTCFRGWHSYCWLRHCSAFYAQVYCTMLLKSCSGATWISLLSMHNNLQYIGFIYCCICPIYNMCDSRNIPTGFDM